MLVFNLCFVINPLFLDLLPVLPSFHSFLSTFIFVPRHFGEVKVTRNYPSSDIRHVLANIFSDSKKNHIS